LRQTSKHQSKCIYNETRTARISADIYASVL
jgi:hypothetical protein